jgi:hypothetical protein
VQNYYCNLKKGKGWASVNGKQAFGCPLSLPVVTTDQIRDNRPHRKLASGGDQSHLSKHSSGSDKAKKSGTF